ncbi:hypothetical protein BG015_004142 [Linnemannia schmuckeri]|uniref:Uncharacterized protein n=1 Tax=Linnemannia schmuckeri TaxID=64567 RepID=A0A9P5V0Q7_9FUNG|nr:hypothetical protein BG015_004142 [Linnemannia schmuckeri]
MSDNVYAKISEKMKNERFTDEEIKIVEKAKEQLSSYTSGGSVIGGAVGLMLARAKNFKGLQVMAIGMGGFLIGSQIGIIMGAMASVRTIQSIPNFQRVINIVQEVRDEGAVAAGGAPRGPRHNGPLHHDRAASTPSAGTQRFPIQPRLGSELMTDDAVAQQVQPDQGFKDGDGYHGGQDPGSASGSNAIRQDSAWAHVDQRAKELHNSSTGWSQIRQQNMPRSAWNNVREGRSRTRSNEQSSDDYDDHDHRHHDGLGSDSKRSTTTVSSAKTSSWDRIRKGEAGGDGFAGVSGSSVADGPSEFPRTREDLENRPSRHRNQYGDAM